MPARRTRSFCMYDSTTVYALEAQRQGDWVCGNLQQADRVQLRSPAGALRPRRLESVMEWTPALGAGVASLPIDAARPSAGSRRGKFSMRAWHEAPPGVHRTHMRAGFALKTRTC